MTTQKPELMPDEVYISLWKLSEDTALLSIQDESKTDAVKYRHDRVLQAACAERDALRALCEWQPIETAPKDGTRILVCTDGAEIGYRKGSVARVIGYYAPKFTIPAHDDCCGWPIERMEEHFDYQDNSGEWFAHEGFYADCFENQYGDEIAKAISPTHWIPLPTPPSESLTAYEKHKAGE